MKASRARRAFTLLELLVVMAIIAILAGLLVPTLSRAKHKTRAVGCLSNLRQWGQALHLYALGNNGLLPPEGWANPPRVPTSSVHTNAWYVLLPREVGLPPYYAMTWRTNADLHPARSVWLCPANTRPSTGTNLFHYCLNGYVDGAGSSDRPRRVFAIPNPVSVIYLFDSKNLPAVGGPSYVHTNLHTRGAQFLFLDGHVARFRNDEYWDFKNRRAVTNNSSLVWIPSL